MNDDTERTGAAEITRVLGAAGGMGALVLALLWARTHVPAIVDAWVAANPPHASPDLMWVPPPSQGELVIGKAQPRVFTLTLEVTAAAAVAWFALETLLSRSKTTRPVAGWLGALLAVAGVVVAFRASTFAGTVALVATVPVALLFARYEPGGEPDPPPPTYGLEAAVLVLEAIALGWGIWLTLWTAVGILSAVVLVGLVAAAAYRAGADLASPAGRQAIERDALVGSPLLLLAFLGMRRDPSPAWIVLALAASLAIAVALLRWKLPSPKVMTALAAVVAPCAITAIVLMPMRFRELGSIDNFDHESQHLGWINSVTFGKLMMADAGYIYGPLREYLLALYCAFTGGFTLEHVREAHTWTSFAGVAFLLYAGYRVSGGRPWLQLWWVYVLLAHTALVFLVHYKDQLSFGWVDLARSGMAAAAVVGGIEVVVADRRDSSWPWRGFFKAHRALLGWGALCGAGVLYSQDFGPCGVGSVGLAIVADAALRRDLGSPRDRALRALRLGLAWTAGVLLVLGSFFAIYACFGKALLMVHRFMTWTGFLATASWSGQRFVIGADDWLRPAALFAMKDKFVIIDYAMPSIFMTLGAGVVALGAARRAWTARMTVLFALFLFAFTTFLQARIKPDIFHIRSDGIGAVLLFFALMSDLAQVRWPFGRAARAFPVGAVIVAVAAVGWATMVGSWLPLRDKFRVLATGDESPQHGDRYDNADVPRAGDVKVPGDAKALVRFVNQTTKPTDPVWVTTGFMTGGALAFVIDRRDPTPFDVAHELTTRGNQEELLAVLRHDPPVLIVGDYFNLIGDEARAYIEAHWKKETAPGYGQVRRYDPGSLRH
jgi:hypothetical protein